MKEKYTKLVELCDNLTEDNYSMWTSLLDDLFTESELNLIRKNAQLGYIDEVKFIKSKAKHKLRLLNSNVTTSVGAGLVWIGEVELQNQMEGLVKGDEYALDLSSWL